MWNQPKEEVALEREKLRKRGGHTGGKKKYRTGEGALRQRPSPPRKKDRVVQG